MKKQSHQQHHKRSGAKKYAPSVTQLRPMQGVDQKQFILNDIVPITVRNPTNDQAYTCIISADVNGYTWTIQSQGGAVVGAGTGLYGTPTQQFETQAAFYTQYYTKSVHLDLTLTSGGGVYSVSPIISTLNPSGQSPFVLGTGAGDFISNVSSAQNTEIHQPYTKNVMHVEYSRWLVSMSDRAWRQTISPTGTGSRELYPTNASADLDQNLKLPSMTRAFQITVPAGTFDASSGTFVFGLFKIRTAYMFSQRRTNISDLLEQKTLTIRQEERAKALAMLKVLGTSQDLLNCKEQATANGYPTIE